MARSSVDVRSEARSSATALEGARATGNGADRGGRAHWVDWLRIAALLGVFVFHALHPFDTFDWHIKNAQQSEALSLVLAFLFPWGLGLFFMLAGGGAYFSLRSRGVRGYGNERIKRIVVPFLGAFVLLAPVQAYLEEAHSGLWRGSLLGFIPHFFARLITELPIREGRFEPLLTGWSYHLWFLMFLAWFALLGLPIFLALNRPRGRRVVSWLARRSSFPGSTLLFGLVVAAAHIALRAAFPEEHDWGEFGYYFAFFVGGFLMLSDPRLVAAVRRDLPPALALGIVGFAGLLALGALEWAEEWGRNTTYSWRYALMFGLFSFQAWAWVVAVTALAMRVPTWRRPLPRTVRELAMPFFLLHQPLILAVAYVIVPTSLGLGAKLALVLLSSFLLTIGLASLGRRVARRPWRLGPAPSEGTPAFRVRRPAGRAGGSDLEEPA